MAWVLGFPCVDREKHIWQDSFIATYCKTITHCLYAPLKGISRGLGHGGKITSTNFRGCLNSTQILIIAFQLPEYWNCFPQRVWQIRTPLSGIRTSIRACPPLVYRTSSPEISANSSKLVLVRVRNTISAYDRLCPQFPLIPGLGQASMSKNLHT